MACVHHYVVSALQKYITCQNRKRGTEKNGGNFEGCGDRQISLVIMSFIPNVHWVVDYTENVGLWKINKPKKQDIPKIK
jgi:hypothetical protein